MYLLFLRSKSFIALLYTFALAILLVLSMPLVSTAASNGYKLPYPGGKTSYVSAGNKNGDNHQNLYNAFAWDFELPKGSDIVASKGGKVISAYDGSNATGINDTNCGHYWYKYTNYVLVDHGNGESSIYVHIAKGSLAVSVGSTIIQGQKIASVGAIGCASGPHLHYSVMRTPAGTNYGNRSGNYWGTSLSSTFDGIGVPTQGKTYTSNNYLNTQGSSLKVGDSVKVSIPANDPDPVLYVWERPCGGKLYGKMPRGKQGKVTDGANIRQSCFGGTWTWNKVRFDGGPDGWVASEYLIKL